MNNIVQNQGNDEMIHVIASIQIQEGRLSEFIEIFKSNIPHVLKEKGCIKYQPAIDLATGLPPPGLRSQGGHHHRKMGKCGSVAGTSRISPYDFLFEKGERYG